MEAHQEKSSSDGKAAGHVTGVDGGGGGGGTSGRKAGRQRPRPTHSLFLASVTASRFSTLASASYPRRLGASRVAKHTCKRLM